MTAQSLYSSKNSDRFGFWEVNGKKYYNKLAAVLDAKTTDAWPHFNFNQQTFDAHDWSQEPVEDLIYLYQKRARDLRRRYQHIFLEFSGGADSWNMVYSFFRQGLTVEGLIYRHDHNSSQDSNDLSAANCAAEGRFSAYPWYKKFLELVPGIPWITHEITESMKSAWSQTQLDPLQFNMLHPGYITKIPFLFSDFPVKLHHLPGSLLLCGVDKPNLFYKDNKFYLYFPDYGILTRAVLEKSQMDLGFDDCLFYWDPDCVDLLCKQAHIIMRWFRNNSAFLPLISDRTTRNSDQYHKIVNRLIYPDYQEIWQTDKATGHYIFTHELWFDSDANHSRARANWQKTCSHSSDLVYHALSDSKNRDFLQSTDQGWRLPASWSKFYYIGDLHP